MRKGIVDRFEEDIVVIEYNGITEDFPRKELPDNCNVGDVLIFDQDKITLDASESINRSMSRLILNRINGNHMDGKF